MWGNGRRLDQCGAAEHVRGWRDGRVAVSQLKAGGANVQRRDAAGCV